MVVSVSIACISGLLVLGLSLPGSSERKFQFFHNSTIQSLSTPLPWVAALQEVIYSFSIASGVLTYLGSQNKANTNHFWYRLSFTYTRIKLTYVEL